MGRELRRVPLDFDWPLHEVWAGFLNPHRRPCPAAADNNCHGGATNACKWLDAIASLIALVGEEGFENTPENRERMVKRGRIYPHPYLQEWNTAPRTDVPHPIMEEILQIKDSRQRYAALDRYSRENPPQLLTLDSEIAEVVEGLSRGRKLGDFMSQISYDIYRTLLETAGIKDENWGTCKVCDGDGLDPECREVYENWVSQEPPTGEGWQLWETVSEGSPISPVFSTEDDFVACLVSRNYSLEAARAFTKSGWAPTAMSITGEDGSISFLRDIESCGTT